MEVMSAKQKYVSEPPTNLSHWSEMKYEMKFTKWAFEKKVVASKNTEMLQLTQGELLLQLLNFGSKKMEQEKAALTDVF